VHVNVSLYDTKVFFGNIMPMFKVVSTDESMLLGSVGAMKEAERGSRRDCHYSSILPNYEMYKTSQT
jgi:hypothetical protein